MIDYKKKNLVTIVIPIYKSFLVAYEEVSIRRCCEVFKDYDIILVKPISLNIEAYSLIYDYFLIESFEDDFFENIDGYNKLMLSEAFYSRFLKYKFMLIYQLDAFVFSDELVYWCKSGYDYIGAPWLKKNGFKHLVKKIFFLTKQYMAIKTNQKEKETNLPKYIQFMNKVGNGGFSLRNIERFYEIAIIRRSDIEYYNKQLHHFFNEDVFWSLEVNRKGKKLRIPNYKKGNLFSFEQYPEYALKLSNGQLPFGCHNWDKYPDFWRDIFKSYGYNI